jgi:cytochrome b
MGVNMRNQLVYDLPLRLFHWIFAGLFVAAFLIAKTVDDDSVVFSYHMLAGLLLSFVVGLRISWGLVGTRHSRFSSFALKPQDLVAYFVGVLSGDKRKWSGHNPASSWATLAMLALAVGLGLTGYLMTKGQKELFEDVHELLANGFLVIVLLHIVGVFLHAFRHQDRIAFSMIDGAKKDMPSGETISGSRPAVAMLFLGLVATFAGVLAINFDSQTRTLNLLGAQLQLGENESSEVPRFNDEGDDNGEKDSD